VREALVVLEHDLRVKTVNQAFYDYFRVTPAETEGRMIYDLGNGQWNIPALRKLLEDILSQRQWFDDYEVEHTFEAIGRRTMLLNARRLDHLEYILLAIRDVTEQRDLERRRKQSERRQRLLIELHDQMRPLRDPDAVQEAVCALLARSLNTDQVAYATIDDAQETAIITREWNGGAMASNIGRHRLADFGEDFIADLKAGRTIAIGDVRTDPRTASAAAHFASRGVAAFLNVPLVKVGRLTAVLAVHHREPREWSPADIALLEEVAERSWSAVERARSESELANVTALLDAIFQSAPIGIAFFDRELRFQRINAHLAEMNGLPPVAHIGKRPDELFPALEGITDVTQRLQSIVETGEPWLSAEIHGATRAPGNDRYWLENFYAVRLNGEVMGVAATVEEITEAKRRDRQIEFLIRELNHRSKNMLSLVQAIASQTGRGTAPEFVAQFCERIQSLSTSQDLLLRNQWKSAEIGDLVRSQLGHFENLIGERIHIEGPPLALTAAAAQTVGMAIHELATNAAKYGALKTPRGDIDIHWECTTADPSVNGFRMEWRERGGPPVQPAGRKGFGSAVLVTMVKVGLRASVDLDAQEEGLRWRMSCPLDAILGRA
jgi:PAS domain S-box-containing protein